jgi:hypothetical protein
MLPETVLQIILVLSQIALEIVKGIPDSEHAAFWAEHRKRMEFWDTLFRKLHKD